MKRAGLIAAALLALLPCTGIADNAALPALERVMLPAKPKPIADFELTDQNGRALRFSDLRGKPVLVFFGFAHCPDVCPAALYKLRKLKESAPEELRDVRVVMISIDGDRDTPEMMRSYLATYSPDFIGLTGSTTDVRDIAARFSAVFFKGLPRDASGAYLVEHTAQVYAIDRAGQLRAEFYDASVETMHTLTLSLLRERLPE